MDPGRGIPDVDHDGGALARACSLIRALTLSSMAVREKSVSSSAILPASILEVQDVVDDAQQMLGGVVYLLQPLVLDAIRVSRLRR